MYEALMAPYVREIVAVPTAVPPEIHLKSPVRAILFDIYGTLFISDAGGIVGAENNSPVTVPLASLLKKYNFPIPPDRLRDLLFRAIETHHAAKKTMGIDFPEVEIDEVWMSVLQTHDREMARRFAVEYEMIVNPVYPMPHMEETLHALKADAIILGIISNAQFFTPHLFSLFCHASPQLLGFDPDLIFYSYEYGHAKPSLFLFEQAARHLAQKGVQPDNVLYVGNDMLNDVFPAKSVGFQTCLFAGDRRSLRLREDDAECKSLKPDLVIKGLNQLTDMIG